MTSRYKSFVRHITNILHQIKRMEQIRNQAFETFGKNRIVGETFNKNLNKLISTMSRLTAEDVNLDKELLQPRTRNSAPVTYVEILEHPCFTINMFVLRPGSKLPLHDHPHMYGICKVVKGKVKVRYFSLDSENTALEQKKIIASVEPGKIITEDDAAMLLTPKKGNIHEIYAVDGGAAFVDVLAPPYSSDIDGRGPRPCNYFVERKFNDNDGFVELVKVDRVAEYWTDIAPYLGP